MKIIFLDIDGPMIPTRAYLFHPHASLDQELDPICVRVLRKILDDTGAQVVFNTTHNLMLEADSSSGSWPGLLNQFAKHGFIAGRELHPISSTVFPRVDDRLSAIRHWLINNYTETWVALDDVHLDDSRAFTVDPDHGIGFNEYQHCLRFLGGTET